MYKPLFLVWELFPHVKSISEPETKQHLHTELNVSHRKFLLLSQL